MGVAFGGRRGRFLEDSQPLCGQARSYVKTHRRRGPPAARTRREDDPPFCGFSCLFVANVLVKISADPWIVSGLEDSARPTGLRPPAERCLAGPGPSFVMGVAFGGRRGRFLEDSQPLCGQARSYVKTHRRRGPPAARTRREDDPPFCGFSCLFVANVLVKISADPWIVSGLEDSARPTGRCVANMIRHFEAALRRRGRATNSNRPFCGVSCLFVAILTRLAEHRSVEFPQRVASRPARGCSPR